MHGLEGLFSVQSGPSSSLIFFPAEGTKALSRNSVPPENRSKISTPKDITGNVPDPAIIPFLGGDRTMADIRRAPGRVFEYAAGAA
jgi:hypothetical protein